MIGLSSDAGKRTALGLKLAHKKLSGDASHNEQCDPSIGGRTSRLTAAMLTQPFGRHISLKATIVLDGTPPVCGNLSGMLQKNNMGRVRFPTGVADVSIKLSSPTLPALQLCRTSTVTSIAAPPAICGGDFSRSNRQSEALRGSWWGASQFAQRLWLYIWA